MTTRNKQQTTNCRPLSLQPHPLINYVMSLFLIDAHMFQTNKVIKNWGIYVSQKINIAFFVCDVRNLQWNLLYQMRFRFKMDSTAIYPWISIISSMVRLECIKLLLALIINFEHFSSDLVIKVTWCTEWLFAPPNVLVRDVSSKLLIYKVYPITCIVVLIVP